MRYFKNGNGPVHAFTDEEVSTGWVPTGLVELSSAEQAAHLAPPAVEPITRAQVEGLRLRAYADPLTGSDRYFAEAQRESLTGNAEAAEAAKALGMARFAEIQADNPWPAE